MTVRARIDFCQRTVGEDSLPSNGSVILMKRTMRTYTRNIVGVGGERPPAIRLCGYEIYLFMVLISISIICQATKKIAPVIKNLNCNFAKNKILSVFDFIACLIPFEAASII